MEVMIERKQNERIFAHIGIDLGTDAHDLYFACWANCVETEHDFEKSDEQR